MIGIVDSAPSECTRRRPFAAMLVLATLLGLAFFVPSAHAAKPKTKDTPVLMRAASGPLELGQQSDLFNVPGLGKLSVSRGNAAPSASVRLTNTSDRDLTAMRTISVPAADGPASFSSGFVSPGEQLFIGGITSYLSNEQVAVFPSGGRQATPSALLDVRISPGGYHVVATILAKRAQGYLPGWIRQSRKTYASSGGGAAPDPTDIISLPGIGDLTAQPSCCIGNTQLLISNSTPSDLELDSVFAGLSGTSSGGRQAVFSSGSQGSLASASEQTSQWASVFPADLNPPGPFALLAVNGNAGHTHASALTPNGGSGAKRAVGRTASLSLSRGQKERPLLALPGIGKLTGSCGATEGGGGVIELDPGGARGFIVNDIEGFRNDFSGPQVELNTTLAKGSRSAFFGRPSSDETFHLVSIYPEDPARSTPHLRIRLGIEDCNLWAMSIGAGR